MLLHAVERTEVQAVGEWRGGAPAACWRQASSLTADTAARMPCHWCVCRKALQPMCTPSREHVLHPPCRPALQPTSSNPPCRPAPS